MMGAAMASPWFEEQLPFVAEAAAPFVGLFCDVTPGMIFWKLTLGFQDSQGFYRMHCPSVHIFILNS